MPKWELLWLEKSKKREQAERIENLEIAPEVLQEKGRYTLTPGSTNAYIFWVFWRWVFGNRTSSMGLLTKYL